MKYRKAIRILCKGHKKILSSAPMQFKAVHGRTGSKVALYNAKAEHMKIGNEYEIIIWDDYQQLKGSIDALDSVLQKLKTNCKRC